MRVCPQQTLSITSTGHAVGKRARWEEWAVVDVLTIPDHMVKSGPIERAGLGRDWKGRQESTIDLETGVMPCTFEKEQRGQYGWGGGRVGVEKFHGNQRRLKEGFQLSLEGSVFLEFLEARRAGSKHLQEPFSFTGGWVPPKVWC